MTVLTTLLLFITTFIIGPIASVLLRGRAQVKQAKLAKVAKLKEERMKYIEVTRQLAKKEMVIKEIAEVFGIDGSYDNEVDTSVFMRYENWRDKVDKDIAEKVEADVLKHPSYCSRTSRKKVVRSRQTSRVVSATRLLFVPEVVHFQAVIKGGEKDVEDSSSQSVPSREYTAA